MMNRLLRKDAMELRELVLSGKDPYARKQEMLAEIIRLNALPLASPSRL